MLNKPRLVSNANKVAKLLVSETGLGVETGNDLANLSLGDLSSHLARSNANALYGMPNGRALLQGDDTNVSGHKTLSYVQLPVASLLAKPHHSKSRP